MEQDRTPLGQASTSRDSQDPNTQVAIEHLVRGLAHELNNPLAVILGHAQRMALRLGDPEDCRRRLGLICDEVQRCIDLVARLRRYANPVQEEPVPCALPGLITRAQERLRRHALVAPMVCLPETCPMLLVARDGMERALECLLANAVEAGARQVIIGAGDAGDGRWRLHVDNDGRSPDDHEVSNALRPFFSTSSTGGRGVGLTLAHQLLRDMSGTLIFDRRPDGPGARVTLEVPVAPQDQVVSASGTGGFPVLRQHVLVIDDQPLVLELISDALVEQGCTVRSCNTGHEALEALAAERFDACLCDFHLPDVDGVELLHTALAGQPHLHGHLALVTGDAQDAVVTCAAEEMDLAVLAKPFRLQQVIGVLDRILAP